MIWKLSEALEGVWVEVDESGIWIKGNEIDLNDPNEIIRAKPKNRLGRIIPALIPQIVQLGIAHQTNKDILIYFDDFADLEGSDIDAFDDLVPWSPFAIEIETRGSLGRSDFNYQIRFYWGNQQVHIERIGCFVKRGEIINRLEKRTFTLLEAVKKFNSLSIEEREKPGSLIYFSRIKGIAEDIGAQLDKYIKSEKVLVPAKINLDFIEESDGRITFVPIIDRVPKDEFFQIFLSSDNEEDIYAVSDRLGGRIRIILDETQKEVLRRMRKIRHVSGVDKASVLRNPYEVFDGVADAIEINLNKFGPRVKGIGDFPFISQPFIKYSETGIFEESIEDEEFEKKKFEAGIFCKYLDGTEEKIIFESSKDLLNFFHKTKVAWENGQHTVDLKDKIIVVDKKFFEGLKSIIDHVTKPKNERQKKKENYAYLLIYTNEDQLDYHEDEEINLINRDVLPLPKSLSEESLLKCHQREGLKWLQENYLLRGTGRRGCLLADEMGLGKTLQILTFLAWLIEHGKISPSKADPEKPPWNPILIIAPLMLLENEGWQGDMKKFFREEGAIFEPYLVLHGAELKRMRRPELIGRETLLKEAVLDLEQLKQFRVIITSYETIINYQYSLAMMKDSWSVVVTDEAQEYKTPNTKISHALKSLAPQMRIACTGTPVETKLMDVWNIFDFLQPGVLGSASDFVKRYERPLQENPDRQEEILTDLKNRLFFGQNSSYILRREKETTLEDIPKKEDHKIYCPLSAMQRAKHIDFINQVRVGLSNVHPLAILPQLMKLYQHPDLLPTYKGLREDEIEDSLERSPKLKTVLDLLEKIRRNKEKVLIFTRSLHMQQLLATLFSSKFGISVDIINGVVPKSGGTKSGIKTRKEGIRRFCESEGFNILIVSPDVAGVGLNFVEANHVIHYGRWWNPAKEQQATARAHRIGQKKVVHVYYPIAQDPKGNFKTFDERLDSLLDRRRELAREFLAPMPSETENGEEITKDLFGEINQNPNEIPIGHLSEEEISLLPWDRFESFVALLEKKEGRKVILTPKSADFGMDVISIINRGIRLIQCKHSTWGSSLDIDTIDEIINAFDNYRLRWLRGLGDILIQPILVTNGTLAKRALLKARESDIKTIDCQDLLKIARKWPISLAEIEIMENGRVSSMRYVPEMVREYLSV